MAPRRLRLDAELVRRGLARSRDHAAELIAEGRVTVSGATATKAATGVTTDVALVVAADPSLRGGEEYVSRGGHKLAGALAVFASRIAGPYNGVVQRIAVTLPLAAEILIAGRMLTLPVTGSAAGPGITPSPGAPVNQGG